MMIKDKMPKLNEPTIKEIKHQFASGEIDLDFLITYINKINKVYNLLLDKVYEFEDENIKLKNKNQEVIKKLTRLIDIGYDYDGYSDLYNLKKLIDELVGYAHDSISILQGDTDESRESN